ncbi:hypothetical protein [Mesobacillus subterraneus]|uniref:Uncharacterized protein n=1 Tax=Mesobacillus subterraneus TaxID=285983 RepID=A0A3R9F4A2_9BACI|nr:hypothetical protein [Mesobacillus subterraneus]RSD28715.1 hypothetical protein EJA10_03835 [Mesobacillus subterraneus]
MVPRNSQRGRLLSKRVITARNEMRSSHFLYEFEDDDHDWSKEKKLNSLNFPRGVSMNSSRKSKLKKRLANNVHQEYD